MAAPKGNIFALGNKGGQPPKYKSAEELEVLLCNVEEKDHPYDEQHVNMLIEQCTIQHQKMLKTINNWLAQSKEVASSTSTPKDKISEQALHESLSAIHEKLDSFDSSAIEDIEQILSMDIPTEINNELKTIYEVVSQYDFDTASEQLDRLIRNI